MATVIGFATIILLAEIGHNSQGCTVNRSAISQALDTSQLPSGFGRTIFSLRFHEGRFCMRPPYRFVTSQITGRHSYNTGLFAFTSF